MSRKLSAVALALASLALAPATVSLAGLKSAKVPFVKNEWTDVALAQEGIRVLNYRISLATNVSMNPLKVGAGPAMYFNVKNEGSAPADFALADVFAARNIMLGLETGQETAAVLLDFLQELTRPNVGVNFDPANMILYDKGNPIEALRTLGAWIRQVHIKDARRTKVPGTWGEEVVAGTGEVDWRAFFATLDQAGFKGDFCIEREAGSQRVADIRAAIKLVEHITA